MEVWTILASVSGAIGVIGSVIFAIITFSQKKSKNENEHGEKSGTILSDLGYIKANTEEIKAEQKEQRKVNLEVITRITAVEASAKQAHKRLDEYMGHAKE